MIEFKTIYAIQQKFGGAGNVEFDVIGFLGLDPKLDKIEGNYNLICYGDALFIAYNDNLDKKDVDYLVERVRAELNRMGYNLRPMQRELED